MTIYYTKKKKPIVALNSSSIAHNLNSRTKARVIYKRSNIIYFINKFDDVLLTYLKGKIGWGCGYIAVPKSHPWFGKNYDDIEVSVHGGLTYSELSKKSSFDINDETRWIIGFDTAHYSRYSNKYDQKFVLNETRYLFKQTLSVQEF